MMQDAMSTRNRDLNCKGLEWVAAFHDFTIDEHLWSVTATGLAN
jgi:hypothetical protein